MQQEIEINKKTIDNVDFTYIRQSARKWTFEMPLVKKWVEKWCEGKVLNLYAGKTKINADETRIDVSNDYKPDYHMSDIEFIEHAKNKGLLYNTILLDPDYNLRKAMEKYKGNHRSKFAKVKDEILYILAPMGRVITFGYNSNNMGVKRGFELIAITLICHFGARHDTIATVDIRNPLLEEFF